MTALDEEARRDLQAKLAAASKSQRGAVAGGYELAAQLAVASALQDPPAGT